MANGPFLNCHTTGSNNGGSGIWEALRAGQEARERRDARRSTEQREAMIMLLRMAREVSDSVPADATSEQSFIYRAAALDRVHNTLQASGLQVQDWPTVREDLLAHPELADQALAAMDEDIAPIQARNSVLAQPDAGVSASASRSVPVSSPRCTELLLSWDEALQRGDRNAGQQFENALRLECHR